MNTKLIVRECDNAIEVLNEVKAFEFSGVQPDQMYVLAHERDRTNEMADQLGINTIGLKEEGLGTALKNLFEGRGDSLRNKMQEMGLSKEEADVYEMKLDHGKILLFVENCGGIGSRIHS
ncbi:general stress protein [Bacillus sp. S/N-304-OC-R1]|uniref:general stress protein n=1 Tax=Bacillus sp. S/N-304-OC-R1 TaxID=2758034 RepID=UPI001C8D8597|nr:general stress protein [Bacillus sp. S/N-304-OC-R1]MBY0123387.1 general stress protein [Bacillus sp. S/N-304-OC-R1]